MSAAQWRPRCFKDKHARSLAISERDKGTAYVEAHACRAMVQPSQDFKLLIIDSEQGRESGMIKSRERDDKANAPNAKGVTAMDSKADVLMS